MDLTSKGKITAAPRLTPVSKSKDAGVTAVGKVTTSGKELPKRKRKPCGKSMQRAVNKLTDLTQKVRRELSFQLDESSGEAVINVVDRQTKNLIRQLSPSELLELSVGINNADILKPVMRAAYG